MSEAHTPEPATASAYALDMEMSLLLASSVPEPWSAAVTEAARILAGRSWTRDGRAAGELCTLALLLYARAHTGQRQPHDVPLDELRAALDGPTDREPQIIDEIDRALTATGQGRSSKPRLQPLEQIFNRARNQYMPGASMLADDIEPPAPGPSAMRRATQRLAEFLTDYTAADRNNATAPEVEPAPLLIESPRLQIVSRGSIVPLRCPSHLTDPVRAVRVDGPQATIECEHGHVGEFWTLTPAHVRMAAARATGNRPSHQGTHRFDELLIMHSDAPRESDPHMLNVFLARALRAS